jgi:hypothetical protein
MLVLQNYDRPTNQYLLLYRLLLFMNEMTEQVFHVTDSSHHIKFLKDSVLTVHGEHTRERTCC